ncbi:MAG: PIN domain-containing protein [Candidatus Aerophobetes bacterium]|nr:PIN domain-containing protein [Candidatus Aerophobetes bacterium]
MRFIDTNLFLRYFTRDDEKKAQKVLALLKRVENNEEKITTSPLVIFETIFTLKSFYKVQKEEIKELMLPILNLKGLKLLNKGIYQQALDIYVKENISFADALNATFILKKRIKEIYSYDEDFDKIEGIKRIIP